MMWLYQRDDEACLIETFFDNASQKYVVITAKGLPHEREERFADEEMFRTRLQILEHEMSAQRWTHRGPPVFLKDAWKL